MSLFKAETKEELEKIKKMGVPAMEQAVNAYYSITASEKFREIERLREKARHDEAQALNHAKQAGWLEGRLKEKSEIAKNLMEIGMPLQQIVTVTGLTQEEIEKLYPAI